MRFRNSLLAVCAAVVLMATASIIASAAEHWDVYQPGTVPWDTLRSFTSYQGKLLVSGTKAANPNCLWQSNDAVTWDAVSTPLDGSLSYATAFETFQGSLYMFTVSSSPTNNSGILSVLRSADGLSWTLVGAVGAFGFGIWTDVRVFKNKLYAGDSSGRLQVTSNGTSWSALAFFPAAPNGEKTPLSLAEYQNFLYVGKVIDNLLSTNTDIFRSSDGSTWNAQIKPPPGEMLRAGAIQFADALYWSGLFLEVTSIGAGINPWKQFVVGTSPLPFVMDNVLHVAGLPAQIFANVPGSQTWDVVFQDNSNTCTAAAPRYSRAITLSGSTYIAPCNLMRFQRGVHGVTIASTEQTVLRSQSKIRLATLRFDVNANEHLFKLALTNLGTAQAVNDVSTMAVYKSVNGNIGPLIQVLHAGPDGRKWSTTDSFIQSLVDGDEIIIAADISDQATNGATFRMSVPINGMMFSTNPGYQIPAPLVAPAIQTIAVAAAAPISAAEGLTTYPSPAKDTVRFLYALNESSDVQIEFYDRNGGRVLSFTEAGKPAAPRAVSSVNCAQLPTGIYYATVKITGSGQRLMKIKIAIEK